jgi:hypothetical protein
MGAALALEGDGRAETGLEACGRTCGTELTEGVLHGAELGELGGAGGAGVKVRGDRRHLDAAYGTVQIRGKVGAHGVAWGRSSRIGVAQAHRVTDCKELIGRRFDLATSVSFWRASRSAERPRVRRLLTVPRLSSSISAISS